VAFNVVRKIVQTSEKALSFGEDIRAASADDVLWVVGGDLQGKSNAAKGVMVHKVYHDFDGVGLKVHVLVEDYDVLAGLVEVFEESFVDGGCEEDVVVCIVADEDFDGGGLGVEVLFAFCQIIVVFVKRNNYRYHIHNHILLSSIAKNHLSFLCAISNFFR